MVEKIVGKLLVLVEQSNYCLFLQSYDLAWRHCNGGSQAQWFSGQCSLTAKFVRSTDCDDGFLPRFGYDGNFDFASANVKNRVRQVALRVDDLVFFIFCQGPSRLVLGKEAHQVEATARCNFLHYQAPLGLIA